jgi:hypothetical protein
MGIDPQGEQQNPRTEKNPAQQTELGKTQPRENLNEEYDEHAYFDEGNHLAANPT